MDDRSKCPGLGEPTLAEIDRHLAERERGRQFWHDLSVRLRMGRPLEPALGFSSDVLDTHFWRAQHLGALCVRRH